MGPTERKRVCQTHIDLCEKGKAALLKGDIVNIDHFPDAQLIDEIVMKCIINNCKHEIRKIEEESSKSFQDIDSLTDLKRGDIVRHKNGVHSYVVNSNFGNRVTASRTVDITNKIEWEVLKNKS